MSKQSVDKLAAAVRQNAATPLGLQRAHSFDYILTNDGCVSPHRFLECPRYDILCRSVHEIAKRIARGHRLEGFGVCRVRAPTQEKCVAILHERAETPADVLVPVGHSPATVLEASVTIFVFMARRLDHSVQRHKLRNNQLSHRTSRGSLNETSSKLHRPHLLNL